MNETSKGLSHSLHEVLTEYPIDQIGSGISPHTARADIEQQIPKLLQEILRDENLVFKSSAGQGRWTSIPWIAVMDPRETEQIQNGVYVVYLFEPQEDRVRLTLNQGVTSLKDEYGTRAARQQLRETANKVRSEIELDGFSTDSIEFPHASARNKLYGPGTIFYKEYSTGSIPDDETLTTDLRALTQAYQEWVSEKTGSPREPSVYQCPIKSGGIIERNYRRTVVRGVPRSSVEEICDIPLDHEILHIWGNQESNPATPGDYLLFAERDGRRGGEYTILARVAKATILDLPTAERFTDAIGWGEGIDDTFPHIMFLEPLYNAELERGGFWELLGYRGWPNDTYSSINFTGSRSSFKSEYESVREFIEDIKGDLLYPEKTTEGDGGGEFLAPAGTYESVAEAVKDIHARLSDSAALGDWFSDAISELLIREWNELFTGLEPNCEITAAEEVRGQQVLDFFAQVEEYLSEQAAQLETGNFPTYTPAETLFIVLLRDQQEKHGQTPNFNQVKLNTLKKRSYSVRRPRPIPEEEEEEQEPLTPAPEPDRGRKIRDLLTDVGQLVFYGPPGTGKTYTAQRFARWWITEETEEPTEDQLETVTFHPSFSYEDFIEGLTAHETEDGEVAYEIEAGVFKRIAEQARNAYQEYGAEAAPPYVLVIDEINRGNLAQIFGETITGLELDKRLGQPNEIRITLAHSRSGFTIPPNLYVIGTMNTADRSIALVDAALRRRFRFLAFPPNYDALSRKHGFSELSEVRYTAETAADPYERLLSLSIEGIKQLNDRILSSPDLGKGKQIGHSFLWNVEDVDDLCTVWQFEILPLIEEYHFGQFRRIRDDLFNGGGMQLFDYEREQIRDVDPESLGQDLADLVESDSTNLPDFSGSVIESTETSSQSEWVWTIKAVIERGILEAGDELVFAEERVPESVDRAYDSNDPFWRCELTGNLGQQDNVRWLYDEDEVYSLTGLAVKILSELGEDVESVNGPLHWRVPSKSNQLVRELVDR